MKTEKFNTTKNYRIIWALPLMALMFWGCDSESNDTQINEQAADELSAESRSVENIKIAEKVEVMPEPEEGLQEFYSYIGSNLKYPEKAREQGIQGKVFIRFVITKEGSIKNVEVEKGIGYGLDEEAVRVIAAYDKKWKPGMDDGEAVNTKMVLPVSYALQDK